MTSDISTFKLIRDAEVAFPVDQSQVSPSQAANSNIQITTGVRTVRPSDELEIIAANGIKEIIFKSADFLDSQIPSSTISKVKQVFGIILLVIGIAAMILTGFLAGVALAFCATGAIVGLGVTVAHLTATIASIGSAIATFFGSWNLAVIVAAALTALGIGVTVGATILRNQGLAEKRNLCMNIAANVVQQNLNRSVTLNVIGGRNAWLV